MTGSIVAFFTCSALAVAPSISAQAMEMGGTVASVDTEAGILHLSDGSRFALPSGFDLGVVETGSAVHLLYEPAGSSSLTPR